MKDKDTHILEEAYESIKEARPLPSGELGALTQTDIEDIEAPETYDEDKEERIREVLNDVEVEVEINGKPKLFFDALVEDLPGRFLPAREREIADKMRQAVIDVAVEVLQ